MPHKKYTMKNVPQGKKKRELFQILFLGFISFSLIFYFYYISDTLTVPTNLPKVYITCNSDISKNRYRECVIEVEYDSTLADVRLRGNAKTRYDKKEYRVRLYQPKSFVGMRRDDDWQLFAMYDDFTYMRTKLAFDVWRSLEPSNPTAILPDSEYVNLYLNNEYKGLYLLAEKNDRRLFGLDHPRNNTDSSLIFQAEPFTLLREYDKDVWQQDLPDPENVNIIDEILTNLIYFINNTSNEDFFNPVSGIYSIFYKQNLIDFFIFNLFILHGDFWHHNYFIVRNTNPSKFFMIPWDFDISFGQAAEHIYSANENPESEIRRVNELFRRLLDYEEFRADCKNRWINLRNNLWTNGFFEDLILDNYEEIKDSLPLDWNMWYSKIDDKNYIKILIEWIPERLEYCDSYFSQF